METSNSGYVPTLQLVLVTHAGEWYRLAVPERKYSATDNEQERSHKEHEDEDPDLRTDRCRVLDYADMNVIDEW
jgi:hypothetical protein